MKVEFYEFLTAGGILAAVISAVSVVTQVILNKKLRSPADRTSEVSTVLTFFKEGIADSRADRKALEETTRDLREYVASLEKNSREDFALRVKLEDRIADLERRIREKDERISHLEAELAKYATQVVPNLQQAVASVTQVLGTPIIENGEQK
jgi:predicted RNase H-like nuclease (RuvC/YqgF family)